MGRVVLLCLDGFPAERVSPTLTPNLLELARSGGIAPTGGTTELPSSTYPGHAALLTGASMREHGVHAVAEDGAIVGPCERSVEAPTAIDRARAAGFVTTAVVGDQHLVGVLRLDRADHHWPPGGEAPSGAARCLAGYLRDFELVPRLLEAVASDADLVFGQLNEADTAGHVHGPDGEAASHVYRAADEAVGQVIQAVADRWDETLLVVVSDHGMEPIRATQLVELERLAALDAVLADGGAAWLTSGDGELAPAVEALSGVHSCRRFAETLYLAAAEPGWRFPAPVVPPGGFHGGISTVATLAVVGGGHPTAQAIGSRIERNAPPLSLWAPLIVEVLTGRPVAAPA